MRGEVVPPGITQSTLLYLHTQYIYSIIGPGGELSFDLLTPSDATRQRIGMAHILDFLLRIVLPL
jgi:hypothetical protein